MSEPAPPVKPEAPPSRPLPVTAPTGAFLLQLFFIPLIIVGIVVAVWLLFSLLAQGTSDPRTLVRNLDARGGWQRASSLADLLRDPENEELRHDHELARLVGAELRSQLEKQRMDDESLKLRIFLCRASGEFFVADGLPDLLLAARTQRDEKELDVRRAAVQGLAVLISHVGPEELRTHAELDEALQEASRARPAGDDPQQRYGELRSHAAFALGVLGGEEALQRLADLRGDAYPNVRYNAASGLARHGDVRAIPVLCEMLDPAGPAGAGEETADAQQFTRTLVQVNAARAAARLAEENPAADLAELRRALQRLEESDASASVRLEARQARLQIEQAASGDGGGPQAGGSR